MNLISRYGDAEGKITAEVGFKLLSSSKVCKTPRFGELGDALIGAEKE
jgi:hypothetical protein